MSAAGLVICVNAAQHAVQPNQGSRNSFAVGTAIQFFGPKVRESDWATGKARPSEVARAAQGSATVREKRLLARETGLEPAASAVTGRRSNQLSYSRKPERNGRLNGARVTGQADTSLGAPCQGDWRGCSCAAKSRNQTARPRCYGTSRRHYKPRRYRSKSTNAGVAACVCYGNGTGDETA